MLKHVCTFAVTSLFSISCLAGPSSITCEEVSPLDKNLAELEKIAGKVKEPTTTCEQKTTAESFARICAEIYMQKDASSQEWEDVVFRFQEDMWRLVCADPAKTTLEEARPLLQKWWLENRLKFTCNGYPDSIANRKNVAKFATDLGFYSFLNSVIKEYKFDMNFIDPDDKKTVLDFVLERKAKFEKEKPRNEHMIMDFQNMEDLLRKNGAKTAKEL